MYLCRRPSRAGRLSTKHPSCTGIGETTVSYTKPEKARIGITPADAGQDDNNADTTADAGWQVALNPATGGDGGTTTINIAVTSGDATTFYKIVITRGAAAADATLSELKLVVWYCVITLVPAFSRHTYAATLPLCRTALRTWRSHKPITPTSRLPHDRVQGGYVGAGSSSNQLRHGYSPDGGCSNHDQGQGYLQQTGRTPGPTPSESSKAWKAASQRTRPWPLSLSDIELDQAFRPGANRGVYTAPQYPEYRRRGD